MWTGRVVNGRYRIDGELGSGGFGVVYRAYDQQLKRQCAIKVPRSDNVEPSLLHRFVEEAENLARLAHPNVVRIFNTGEFEGQKFIELEFLEGDTLDAVIQAGRLDIRQRLAVIRQVSGALEAVHRIGILHRDLSPRNIMVDPHGVAKLFDFGLSRDTSKSRTGSINSLKGTWGYFPPELIDGQPMTVAGEVFAVGAILYELLTGANPFIAEHETKIVYNLKHREPEPVTSFVQTCPAALSTLVHVCLAKRPIERPQTITEVCRQLDGILRGELPDSSVPPGLAARSRRSTNLANPYLHRVMIKRQADFIGRETEVQRIISALNSTPPGSISVVGDRKVGKSSLLNHVYTPEVREQRLEQPDRLVMAYMDLQLEKNITMPMFVEMLLELVGRELGDRVDVSNCARELNGIRTMVQRLNSAGIRLVLLLDEFEAITANPNFDTDFYAFLRALANFDVAYVTSSARNLQVLCHTQEIKDSPFFNIFRSMTLTAFQRTEAMELVRVPSSRVGRPLEPYTEQILEISGLFPFYIQLACSHTLECQDEHPGAQPDFVEIRRRFREEADPHFQYLWESLDSPDRDVLVRITTNRPIPDSVHHIEESLISKRYVVGGRPHRLFSAPFADFVLARAGQRPAGSLLSRLFGRRTG